MIRSLVFAASLTLALTGCHSTSEYAFSSFALEGSSGVALDASTGQVNVGMYSAVCTVDLDAARNLDEVVDVMIEEEVLEAEVVDAADGTTLVLDEGAVLVVDPGTGEVIATPPTGGEQALDAVFYGDDVVALLDGCNVGWLEGGARVAAPARACPGELVAGYGLRLFGADGVVYEVTREEVTALRPADSLAWHAKAGLWLTAEGDTAVAEVDGRIRWSVELDGLIDVFPFGAAVGLRDGDGVIWAVPAEGGRPKQVGSSGVTTGRAVGSLNGNVLAFDDQGLVLVRL